MDILPFSTALLIIAIAELGDKTQLLTLALASRYPVKSVLAGVLGASAVLMMGAVIVGNSIYLLLPMDTIKVIAGLIFIAFGVWILRSGDDDDENVAIKNKINPFIAVFLTFAVAEMGDKTQLATIPLAANFNSPVQVFLGATLGIAGANSVGIFLGNRMGDNFPREKVEKVSGALFIIFGVFTLIYI